MVLRQVNVGYNISMKVIRNIAVMIAVVLLTTSCDVDTQSIAHLMQRFDQTTYVPMLRLIAATCYVMGIWFILSAFILLKRYGEYRVMMMVNVRFNRPLMLILVGIILFYIPEMTKVSIATFWGTDSIQRWPVQTTGWKDIFDPVVDIVRIFGYIAFVKGWVLWSRTGSEQKQPGLAGKALMHLVGGILAINIVGTITLIENSF